MSGQVLHVGKRYTLRQEIGDRRHPKRVGRDPTRQAGVAEAAFYHAADVAGGHGRGRKDLGAADGRPKKGRSGRYINKPGRIEVFVDEPLQIMPDRNLSGLAALVEELEAVLVAGVEKIAPAEAGDRADPSGRVDQDRDDRPVAKADDMTQVKAR